MEASDASLGPALFSPPIADLLTQALAQGPTELHLQIEVTGLSVRRWDRVTAPIDGEWRPLRTHPQVRLRRTVPSALSVPPRTRSRSRQRALVLVAGPPGLADCALEPFDTEAALRSVLGALDGLPVTVLAEGHARLPSPEALFDRLAAEEPTLLHIIAHGRHLPRDGDAALYLSGPKGTAAPLRGRTLVQRLAALPARPSLVYLTACESAVAGADRAYGNLAERLIAEAGVSQVIARADTVTVATCLALHRGFYQRLLDHGDASRALSDALAALADRPDLTVPGLWSRPGAGPLFGVVEEGSLTDEERRDGLQRLARALPDRAPTASAELAALRADAVSELGRARIEALCEEVLELRFAALATGAPLPPYEVCCPFLGLHAFDEAHARFFFGRGELITALAARLAAHPYPGGAGALGQRPVLGGAGRPRAPAHGRRAGPQRLHLHPRRGPRPRPAPPATKRPPRGGRSARRGLHPRPRRGRPQLLRRPALAPRRHARDRHDAGRLLGQGRQRAGPGPGEERPPSPGGPPAPRRARPGDGGPGRLGGPALRQRPAPAHRRAAPGRARRHAPASARPARALGPPPRPLAAQRRLRRAGRRLRLDRPQRRGPL